MCIRDRLRRTIGRCVLDCLEGTARAVHHGVGDRDDPEVLSEHVMGPLDLAGVPDPVMDASEIQWAHDVLAEYFRVITVADPVVDRARRAFEAVEHAPTDRSAK